MRLNVKGKALPAFLLFALATAASAAPRLQLNTVAVGPVLVGGGATSQQVVEAANPGDGALNLKAQTSASWLTASIGAQRPCSTTTGNCFPVNIILSAGTLPTGTYTEYVEVTDPNAVDSPQQISVTMTVGGVPSSVTIYGAPGSNGLDGTAAYSLIYPNSTVSGAVTTQSGGNWLRFTLTGGGSFSFGTAYSIQATPLSAMAPGSYSGSVTLAGSPNVNDNVNVGVTFNVTNSPIIQVPVPSVHIIAAPGVVGSGGVSFTNLGLGTLSVTGASIVPSSSTVPASTFTATAGGSGVTITADAGSLGAGIYTGTLSITSNAANNAQVSVPVTLEVQTPNPIITASGIVNIATYQTDGLAQGGIAAVYGSQLAAPGTALSSPTVPLANTIANVQVLVNNVPAPLFYVSPGQVNFQVPYETPAGVPATIQVVNGSLTSNLRTVPVSAALPRIMPWPSYLVPGNNGIIVNYTDGSLVLPKAYQLPGFASHPAKPGDLLVIYCLGFGQTSPGATTGAGGAAQAVPNMTVQFGGGFSGPPIQVTPLFAGLSGGVGLYQVNVYVPSPITYGAAVVVTLNQGGAFSNYVTIPISADGN